MRVASLEQIRPIKSARLVLEAAVVAGFLCFSVVAREGKGVARRDLRVLSCPAVWPLCVVPDACCLVVIPIPSLEGSFEVKGKKKPRCKCTTDATPKFVLKEREGEKEKGPGDDWRTKEREKRKAREGKKERSRMYFLVACGFIGRGLASNGMIGLLLLVLGRVWRLIGGGGRALGNGMRVSPASSRVF